MTAAMGTRPQPSPAFRAVLMLDRLALGQKVIGNILWYRHLNGFGALHWCSHIQATANLRNEMLSHACSLGAGSAAESLVCIP